MYKIFFFLITATFLQAQEIFSFEVENPTMARAYFDVFNSISATLSSVSYYNILHLVFLVGGFVFFGMYVLNIKKEKDGERAVINFFKYMIAGTALMILVLGNGGERNQLKINSRVLQNSYCSDLSAVNGNATSDIYSYSGYTVALPGILPEVFGIINRIGVASTDLASSAFSGVTGDSSIDDSFVDTSYGGFSSELTAPQKIISFDYKELSKYASDINSTTFGVQSAPYLYGSLRNFLTDCVQMTTSAYKKQGITLQETLNNTNDIHATLDDLFTKREINRYTSKGVVKVGTVPEGFISLLYKVDNKYTECKTAWKELYSPLLANIENKELVCDATLKDITKAAVYTMTNDTSSTNLGSVNRMIVQSALINMNQHSKDKVVLGLEYAKNKTLSENAIKFASTGTYMAQMLPYLQMGIRAILYAFFPFAFLFMLLPGGLTVIKNYLSTMLWVELWSPVAAILNLFLSYFAINTMSDTYNTGGGLTAMHGMNLVNDATMLGGVAGYLYTMVPALTWLVLKSSGEMLGNIGHTMAASMAKNLDSANVREDFADIKRLQEYNKNAGAANFVNRAEQLQLEVLEAGIEGGAKAKSMNAVGGIDNYMNLSKKERTLQIINDLAYAKKSSLEAQTALGEGKAIIENTMLKTSGQLDRNGINHEQVKSVNRALGITNGADLLRAEKTIDFISQNTDNTAELLAESKSARYKGDFTEQIAEARQFALANGLTVNGKNPNDASIEELIQFSSTVKQEIGAQDGKNEAVDYGMKQAVLESRGMINGAGVQNELNANTAYKEKVERLETNQKRESGVSPFDIASEKSAETTQQISEKKEQADIYNTGINEASKKLGELEAQNNIWNQGTEQLYRNDPNINIKTEGDNQIFLAAKSDTINKQIKEAFDFLGVKLDSYESGVAFSLLTMLAALPDVDTRAKAKEKLKKLKAQEKSVKEHKKLKEKLEKETDLKKREKIQNKIDKVEKNILKNEATLKGENFDPKTDPQKIVDEFLSKEKKASSFFKKATGIAKSAGSHAKSLVKGGVVGVVVDETADYVYKHSEDGSVTKTEASIVKGSSTIVGEGLGIAFGDVIQLGVAYATNNEEEVQEQLNDIADSRRKLQIAGMVTAVSTYNTWHKWTSNDNIYAAVSEKNGDKIIYKQNKNGTRELLGYYNMNENGNSVYSNAITKVDNKHLSKFLEIRGFDHIKDYYKPKYF